MKTPKPVIPTTPVTSVTPVTAEPVAVSNVLDAGALFKIQSARTQLILDQPFFGVLALRLDLIQDNSQPSGYTDGKVMGYNAEFINGLSRQELLGFICHEVMHCSNGHLWRRQGRHMMKFNLACDFAINPLVEEAGFKIPQGFNNQHKDFHGKSAEWIYNRLPPVVTLTLMGQDLCDGDKEANADGAAEQEWVQATQQAAQVAKMQGKLPECLERYARLNSDTKVDWKSVLHRFVQQACKSDYTWKRPNNRYIPSGLYLPSLRDEQMGAILIGVDTSGSVDEVLLNEFATNVQAIIDTVHPVKTYVMYCDAKVHRTDEFGPDEPITMKLVGGGGTDFRPVFNEIPNLEEQPVCVVYLTDLMGTFPEKPSDIPVLWATPNQAGLAEAAVPFGEVVYIS